MIKFHAEGLKGHFYGFGLNSRIIESLKQGKPIIIDMREVDVSNMQIALFYGETEEEIVEGLQNRGMIPSSFKLSNYEIGNTLVLQDLKEGEEKPGVSGV